MKIFYEPWTYCIVPNVQIMEWLDSLAQITYFWICKFWYDKLVSFPSLNTLSKVTWIKSRTTLISKIEILEMVGLISKEQSFKKDGTFKNNDYKILLSPCSSNALRSAWNEQGVVREMDTNNTNNNNTNISIGDNKKMVNWTSNEVAEISSEILPESTSNSLINHLVLTTTGQWSEINKVPKISSKGNKKIKSVEEIELDKKIMSILVIFNKKNPGVGYSNKTHRNSIKTLLQRYSVEQIETMVETAFKVNGRDFAPTITSPYELVNKLTKLELYLDKHKVF